jgi:hypothetical protein
MMASDAMIFESENGKVWRRDDGALTWDFKNNSSRVSSLVLDLAAELEKTRAELATRVWPLAEVQGVSIEQTCRDLLCMAIAHELVSPNEAGFDPQCFTAGDVIGVANLLHERMRTFAAQTIEQKSESI